MLAAGQRLSSLILQQTGLGVLTQWSQTAALKVPALEFTQHHLHRILLAKANPEASSEPRGGEIGSTSGKNCKKLQPRLP